MFAIIGLLIVIGSTIIGFLMAGGNLLVLIQIAEFVVIGGAALGSLFISAPLSTLKQIFGSLPKVFKSHTTTKEDYLQLLKSFYDLFLIAQRDGLLAIEKHVEEPEQSDILSKNTGFMHNAVALAFFTDTLKVIFAGGVPPHEVEEIMDITIETIEHELKPVIGILTKIADAFPGLGIVAAVLGIIVTMGSINAGAEVVGVKVAAALVGTFLGVLLSYGVLNPIVTNLELVFHHEVQYLVTIKTVILSYTKGNPPIVAVEIARRTIPSDVRPTFTELDGFLRGKQT